MRSSITVATALHFTRAAVERSSSLIFDLSPLSRNFERWQFSTKPGWHVFFVAFQFSLRSEHAAYRAGVHNGNPGRVADPPHVSEIREHVPEKIFANK